MAEKTAVANSVIGQVKGMLDSDKVKARFNDLLGKKAPQYMASIVNTVSSSTDLKKCEASSILAAAFVAASFDLPIDPNLGFAALVPYKRKWKEGNKWMEQSNAQFQMMYKGFVQLAIRSGEYEKMNCSEVYKDEILSYNPITGECEFVTDWSNCTMRDEGKPEDVAGYYAWFRLRSGFMKELYMSRRAVENHAKKYSQSYRYDLNASKQSSKWSTDFDAMAKKTVIKLLLSKWGILSIEMQKAIIDDQKIYDSNGDSSYADNQQDVIEAVDPFETPALEDHGEKESLPSQQIAEQKKLEPEPVKAKKEDDVAEDIGAQEEINEFAAFEEQFNPEELPFR